MPKHPLRRKSRWPPRSAPRFRSTACASSRKASTTSLTTAPRPAGAGLPSPLRSDRQGLRSRRDPSCRSRTRAARIPPVRLGGSPLSSREPRGSPRWRRGCRGPGTRRRPLPFRCSVPRTTTARRDRALPAFQDAGWSGTRRPAASEPAPPSSQEPRARRDLKYE